MNNHEQTSKQTCKIEINKQTNITISMNIEQLETNIEQSLNNH